MELRQILAILYRRKWIIINTFLAIFLTIIIGTMLIRPWYVSTATVFLQRSPAASTLLTSMGMQAGMAPSSYSDTDRADYLALAKVKAVAGKVIEQRHISRERTRAIVLRRLPFLKPLARALGVNVDDTVQVMKAEDLIKRSLISYIFPRPYVNIDQYESTDLITFETIALEPEQASSIANDMAKAFVENESKRIGKDYTGAKEFIQDNIRKYDNEYKNALMAIRKFREHEKSINLDTETAEYLKEISDLKQSQRDLYLSLANTKTNLNPDHPAVIDLQNKIEETKKQIQQKMEKVFGAKRIRTEPALNDLARKATNSENLADLASSDQDPLNDHLYMTDLPRKNYEYAQLNLAATVNQSIYNSLLTYSYQVGIVESIALGNVYIVESATTPEIDDSKHKYPKIGLNSIIAILLGMVFGVGAGLMAEYLDDAIKDPEDLRIFTGITFLGQLFKLKKKDTRLIDEVEPRSPLRESVRTIRTSIRFATIDKPTKIILVTSSVQGEGKSFVASNLAISFANDGKKVLLLDGDLRVPGIHSCFKLDNRTGLTNYLAGDSSLDGVQRQTRVSGLTVMTTGPIPPDPARLVESKKMHQLLEDMKLIYDLVIVDSPPVFSASDAQVLGHWADGAVIVAESGATTRKQFAVMSEMLKKANIEVIGVVLNKAAGRESSSYYR